MPKPVLLILISCCFLCHRAMGQASPRLESAERLAFENKLDSLFLGGHYKKLLEECHAPQAPGLQSACTFNLIGATYFSGDSAGAWTLFNKEIARIQSNPNSDAFELSDLLSKDYAAYKKFLIVSTAKPYLLRIVDGVYAKEAVSDKPHGLQLLHLLIEDQWVRNTSPLYDRFARGRTHLLRSSMDSQQSIRAQRDHSTRVLAFYRQQDKIFSEAEVGRIYYWQRLLLFHEQDLERRKFYHALVVKAVERGALKLESQMSFEMGTDLITRGADDFFAHRTEIQEAYRKKYGKPDFVFRLL